MLDETRKGRYSGKEGLFKTFNLSGAAFMIKTDVFRNLGWFDETYFFTPEDIALSTLLNKKGLGVYVDGDLRLYHIASASSSSMEAAIKPARVRGSLIFYSNLRGLCNPQGIKVGNPIVYISLGLFIMAFEFFRGIKYLFKDTSDSHGNNNVMALTAKNVRRCIFTAKTPKEIFIRYYGEFKK